MVLSRALLDTSINNVRMVASSRPLLKDKLVDSSRPGKSSSLQTHIEQLMLPLDEDSASVTIVGSRTNLGVPALTNLLPQTSLNVATRSPELTQLAVADSKEKKFRAFSGDPAMGSCVLANDVAVEWWQLL